MDPIAPMLLAPIPKGRAWGGEAAEQRSEGAGRRGRGTEQAGKGAVRQGRGKGAMQRGRAGREGATPREYTAEEH
jgi:hypothetical protein